ncbi:hypothetical protein BDZ85DRAFT_262721 [Elsinoe ampelina]|uniref:BHLH domain-containing protein n=1 Tax=Elsinoe ampelina TaxID=302913 RepID=A0A6A6GBM6_9PEZI|nr:hypothetical protein BDZ85DRAFT_262721 [Elsinoe ampelina]
MPTTTLPPTPAASLDITGKTSANRTPSISLGPAAVHDGISDRSVSATPSVNGSESSYHPASPVSPNTTKRKQPPPQQKEKSTDGYNLPPPPSRSRKIIQMKPRQDSTHDQQQSNSTAAEPATTTKGGRKRGAHNGTTAAGRKIARKTAHSLIERRRRSKMNEEFGVLKDMIPACQGQEMHKLAILQASIDYLRYLETCISDLKANRKSTASPPVIRHPDAMDEDPTSPAATSPSSSFPPSAQTTRPPTSQSTRNPYSPNQLPPLSHMTTASSASSPNFTPIDPTPRARQFSLSTNSSANFSPYILLQSTSTSPVFSPQHKSSLSNIAGDAMQRFSLTSPALDPHDRRHEMRPVSQLGTTAYVNPNVPAPVKTERSDREAMAALLMLNSDRRSTTTTSGWRDGASAPTSTVGVEDVSRHQSRDRKRGSAMSVKDLLSS